jgi:chitinase
MWRNATRFANIDTAIGADNPNEALQSIRSVITIINYLNDPRVRPYMVDTLNEIRREWGLVDQQWVADRNEAVYI